MGKFTFIILKKLLTKGLAYRIEPNQFAGC